MRKIFRLLVASMLIVSLGGCSGTNNPQATPEVAPQNTTSPTMTPEPTSGTKETLTIGVMGSVDAVPLIIAKEKGFFDKQGVNVNVEIFKAAKDRDAALQAGALDGVICDEIAIAIYQNADIDMKITGITDGQFALVAGKDSGIEKVSDLVGKKVAISENTVIEYTLDKMLEAHQVDVAGVEKVVIPPMPTRLEMLNKGEVDAAIMPNPFSDAAIAEGGKMIEKVDQTGKYISVTAFLQEAIDKKPNEIKAFYRAYNEAANYLNTANFADYEDTVIRIVGYPETMKGNITLPNFRINALPPTEEIEEVLEWSRNKGILTKDITATDVVSDIGLVDVNR